MHMFDAPTSDVCSSNYFQMRIMRKAMAQCENQTCQVDMKETMVLCLEQVDECSLSLSCGGIFHIDQYFMNSVSQDYKGRRQISIDGYGYFQIVGLVIGYTILIAEVEKPKYDKHDYEKIKVSFRQEILNFTGVWYQQKKVLIIC